MTPSEASAFTSEAGMTLSPTIGIRPLDGPEWGAFVSGQPEATIFHHPAWAQLLADTYGYRSFALVQTNPSGEIVAGLPVVATRRRLMGTAMVSLPFADHCPPLAQDAGHLAAFADGLVAWRQMAGCRRLDIRAEIPPRAGIYPVLVAVRHVLTLDGGGDEVRRRLNRTPSGRAIRKAERLGVEVRITQSAVDLPAFYHLHWRTRQRLGVPVQPRRFVEALWAGLIQRQLGFLVVASKDERPIAAAVFLAWNRQLIYKYGASDPRYWELRPNHLVMATAIEWACARNYRLLDFGKTDLDNPGLRDFKRRWGSVELPLTYSYLSAKPPRASSGLSLRLVSRLIKRSPPIVCRAIGELFYGRFGASGDTSGRTHLPLAGAKLT